MRIYCCKFTGEEVMSEVMPAEEIHNGTILKVQSKQVPVDDVGEVNIGSSNHFGGGDEEPEYDADVELEYNCICNFDLTPHPLSKKDLSSVLKGYITSVVAQLKKEFEEQAKEDCEGKGEDELKKALEEAEEKAKAEAKKFNDGVKEFIKGTILPNFSEVETYLNRSESYDGGIIFSMWEKDDAPGPVFYYIRHGLDLVKC